ncbi:MAG TPA: amidohydrolase family protein [Gemmatales bacterium]|nr:amidohydrolase family protein [Gemmatales bacterium]
MHTRLLVGLVLLFPLPSIGQDKPLALQHARIHTASGPVIEDGTLVIHQGKIIAIGDARDLPLPEGAETRDLKGSVIIPGLVDTHSHIGIFSRPSVPAHQDGSEGSGPVQPGLRAIDAIYPDDPGIRMALAGGVTTANIMPGSGNVIGGQTLYVKLRGHTIDEMRIANMKSLGGLKMANGENPKGYGRKGLAPVTRMKVTSLQREQFVKARDYQAKWNTYRQAKEAGKAGPMPETDPAMETLVEVLERKRTVHFHSHRADDLMSAVRLSEEFGFELVLQHVTEGYRVAGELAKRKIPVSLTLVDSPGGKPEVVNLIEENAAILNKAGVMVAINTDDFITESRFMLRTGSIAVRGGMPDDDALKALTINPAKMMHLDDRLGSIEKGKDADFVVLTGAPFSVYTQVLETFIDGKRVFNRADRRDWSFQAGGYALELDRLPKTPELIKPLPTVKAEVLDKDVENRDAKQLVIIAQRIHTVSNGIIEKGIIVVEDGKIKSVSKVQGRVEIPVNARVISVAEVTPGLIDTHTVVGIAGQLNVPADQDQDETSDPNQAELRVMDGYNPNEGLVEYLRNNGITTIHAVPGRMSVFAGQTGVFHTAGRTAEAAKLRFPAGMLINLGETPKSAVPTRNPMTRMATAAMVRTNFTQARDYLRKRADEPAKTPHNVKFDALEPALQKKLPVIFSAHRSDDLLTALRISDEFQLKPILDLATEAYLIPDQVIAAKVPVIVHPTMQRVASSMETIHSYVGNAASLADRGAFVTIGTGFEGYVPKSRVLRYEMAIAAVNGLGRDRALKAVTLDAAKLLQIDDKVGSIEPGKLADLVLYDGDPLENSTHVMQTIIDGKVVYDRAEYLRLPFARRALPMFDAGGIGCCLGW